MREKSVDIEKILYVCICIANTKRKGVEFCGTSPFFQTSFA